jgi:hypothetical protein
VPTTAVQTTPVSSRPAAQPAGPTPAAVPTTPTAATVLTDATRASPPVTGAVASLLRPVTGTVQGLTGARPVSSLVDTLDGVVAALPVAGGVVGDDTLGTVTAPVTGVVDDALGGVGTVVGGVPAVVADPLPPVLGTLPGGSTPLPQLPVPPVGGGSGAVGHPGGSAGGTADPRPTVRAVATSPTTATRVPVSIAPASIGLVVERSAPTPGPTAPQLRTDGPLLAPAATVRTPDSATLGGTALFVPQGTPGEAPLGDSGLGLTGGTTTGSTAGAGVVGTVGASADQDPLAAGTRGSIADDVVPTSLPGDHDVAPD